MHCHSPDQAAVFYSVASNLASALDEPFAFVYSVSGILCSSSEDVGRQQSKPHAVALGRQE